ncbi:hypothetical protein EGT74_20025 [Chitinophaga lutea]|uniref:DUF1990 family protein n=1 Tax=Chitinophaga lutea TaxID=2488634 RepID=A0A3N4Q011_9BACT|nr:hypothetical protein [Chitinophaga lutea]RPE09290.1 hypothetical protein EGT74_20025 [Chitinophaga lutea]
MNPASPAPEIVPPQLDGVKTNTSYTVRTEHQKAARELYQTARTRLLDVNHWKDISGRQSAVFTLTDSDGHFARRLAREGDLIRISIPGPAAADGQEYDWVQVERIFEASGSHHKTAYIGMRVRPVKAPDKIPEEVSHFFTDDATSSFVVEKRGKLVRASVYGRNEQPNTTVTRLGAVARNLLVWLGALLGFSKMQWKSLVRGILRD